MNKKKISLPDFDKLNDRMIAEPTNSPTLVIKTNLDSNSNDNPYSPENKEPSEEFKNFFKG